MLLRLIVGVWEDAEHSSAPVYGPSQGIAAAAWASVTNERIDRSLPHPTKGLMTLAALGRVRDLSAPDRSTGTSSDSVATRFQ